ncbi:MAG: pyridoxamine 5'-phosphate oxidase family protein [Candidatus Rokuibacteriota bacterium]
MSDEELARFLAGGRVVTCATIGPTGRPHLMPLWYVVEAGIVTSWTFAKSQKVRNLERRPQATLQVEAGDAYHELRGAMLECDVEIVRDVDAVTTIGAAMAIKYLGLSGVTPQSPDVRAGAARQAPKRVGLRFHPTRIVTWDHRKLGAPPS